MHAWSAADWKSAICTALCREQQPRDFDGANHGSAGPSRTADFGLGIGIHVVGEAEPDTGGVP